MALSLKDPRKWRTYKVPDEVAQVVERAIWVAISAGVASNEKEAIEAMAVELINTYIQAALHDKEERKKNPYRLAQYEAFDRDGWRCVLCEHSRNLQTHHITPRSHQGSDAVENLATVCAECHSKITHPQNPDWHWRTMKPRLEEKIGLNGRYGYGA